MHNLVVAFFQFLFVLQFLLGQKRECVLEGAGRGFFGEGGVLLHGGVFTAQGVLQHGLVVGVVSQIG